MVWLTRRDSIDGSTRVNRDSELLHFNLKRNGFKLLEAGRMNTREKVVTFSDADIVGMENGAGIQNIVYFKRDVRILLIMTPSHWGLQRGFRLEQTIVNAVRTWLPHSDIRRHWSNATMKSNMCAGIADCKQAMGYKQNRPYVFKNWNSALAWIQHQLT